METAVKGEIDTTDHNRENWNREFQAKEERFDNRFEDTFHLEDKVSDLLHNLK